MMQLLGVVLCGALLGVAQADSTVKYGSSEFIARVPVSSLTTTALKVRLVFTSINDRSTPGAWDCDSTSFQYQSHDFRYMDARLRGSTGDHYFYEIPDTSANTKMYVAGNGLTASVANLGAVLIPGSSDYDIQFNRTGKWKMCGCALLTGTCETAPPAAGTATTYTIDLGFLNVVESTSAAGASSEALFNQYIVPGAARPPQVILEGSQSSTSLKSIQASWYFTNLNQNIAQQNKLRVIYADDFLLDENTSPYEAGWQCGQQYPDGNATKPAIAGTTLALTVTETKSVANAFDNSNGNPLYTANSASTTSYRVDSESFSAPVVTPTTGFARGFLCYCDISYEGDCASIDRFGTALGAIVFRQFAVSDQTKHFTVRATTSQTVVLTARSDMPFNANDKLGLVRQNTYELSTPSGSGETGYERLSSSGSNFDYRGLDSVDVSSTRRCGWSNLDVMPGSSSETVRYTKNQENWQVGVDGFNSTATFSFDFIQVYTARYQMCLCQASFLNNTAWLQSDQRLLYTSQSTGAQSQPCPEPAMSHSIFKPTAYGDTNNFEGSYFNLFYAESAGYLHVVNTFAPAVTLVLQSENPSHISVNLMSRTFNGIGAGRRRDPDYKYYTQRENALKQSRFYVTEGECGAAASTHVTNMALATNMYIRLKDTGGNFDPSSSQPDEKRIAWDPATADTSSWSPNAPGTSQKWGSLWSLSTGWESDPFKPTAGLGAPTNSVSRSQVHSQSAGTMLYASSAAEGLALKLCMCDQLTEFPFSGFQQHSSFTNGFEEKIVVGQTCKNRAQNNDYSNFRAEIGTLRVTKFVFSSNSPKHYTVFKLSGQSISMQVPAGQAGTDSTLLGTTDKVSTIPFYGDGYGVDNDFPAYTATANNTVVTSTTFQRTTSSFLPGVSAAQNKPWKTSYSCGVDIYATGHFFSSGNISTAPWTAQTGTVMSVSSTSASEVVTTPQDFTTSSSGKFQLCYCSAAIWGTCPTLLDSASQTTGFNDAYRYSDFAGYLHIVDPVTASTTFPVYTFADATAVSYQYSIHMNGATADLDQLFFAEASTGARVCGVSPAYGQASGILNSSTGNLNTVTATDVSINSPYYGVDPPSPLALSLCYCFSKAERTSEYTTSSLCSTSGTVCQDVAKSVCQAASITSFGAELGGYNIQKFVTKRPSTTGLGRHFTVTNTVGEQTIAITDYDAAALLATTATTANATKSDQVGFMRVQDTALWGATRTSLNAVCGTDALKNSGVVVDVATQTTAEVTTAGYDFVVRGFVPNEIVRVCYCQVSLLAEGTFCSYASANHWYDLGYLHMVDMAVWPQSWVLAPIGVADSQFATGAKPIYRVAVNGNANFGANSKIAISGAVDAGALTCGDNNGIPTAQIANTTWFSTNFPSANATQTTGFLTAEFDLSSAVETVGAANFRWICMCNSDEWEPSALLQNDPTNSCGTGSTANAADDATEWAAFGMTLGKVYLAKTLSLPPTSTVYNGGADFTTDSNYHLTLTHHFTVSQALSDQSFQFATVSTATASQAIATTSDRVGFVGQDDACGTTSASATSPIVVANATQSSVAVQPTTIISALAPFDATQAYKFKICVCRTAIAGACTDAWQFPEMLGYLHVVDVTAASFQVGFSEPSGSPITIAITFANTVTNGQNDRFMVIPNNHKCGQYDVSQSGTGITELDNGGVYVNVSNTFNGIDGYVGWTDSSGAGLGAFSSHRWFEAAVREKTVPASGGRNLDYLSRYEPTIDATTRTILTTPPMFFLGKADFKLCYCSPTALSGSRVCPSRPATSASFISVWSAGRTDTLSEHFELFGAELGVINALVFLTQTNYESSTIYGSEPDAQIRITKTSPIAGSHIGGINVDTENDYWGLVSASGTCGVQSSGLVRYGTFSTVSGSTYRNNGWMSVCNGGSTPDGSTATTATPPTNYQCTDIFTQTNANSFVGLAAGKYKICLCSAASTSASGSTCSFAGSLGASDFGDHAGYLNVLPGTASSYASQTAMVNLQDATATVGIQFDPTVTLSTSDRFGVINSNYQCGDNGYSQESIFTGATLDTTPYSVSNGRLTAGPLTFSTAGVYKLCYCSMTIEGSCATLANYGVTAGTLIVSDLKFGDTGTGVSTVWSVSQRATASLTLHYAMNIPSFTNPSHIKFVAASSPCTATGTPALALPSSGVATTYDFSAFYASRTFFRVCIFDSVSSTDPEFIHDFSGLGVWISDVDVNPKFSQQVATDISLTYTSSLSYGIDSFWFRISSASCDPAPATATTDSTGVHAIGGSGAYVTGVDMTNLAPSSQYRLCAGSSCIAGSCTSYFDFQGVRFSVLGTLAVTPTAVGPTSTTLTMSYDVSVLGSYSIWFQRETQVDGTAYPCEATAPSAASTLYSNSAPIASTVTLDFSNATASQSLFRLCGKTASGTSQSFAPVGVTIADVVVTPRTVSQMVAPITIRSNQILFVNDIVFFKLRTLPCGTVAPVSVAADTTNAVAITAAAADATYDFDFSQMSGECRMCLIPKGTVGQSLDLDGYVAGTLETRVSVADIALDRTSVTKNTGQSIVITYGAGTMSTAGLVWFQTETGSCNKPPGLLNAGTVSSTNTYSSTESAPASGNSLSFDFSLSDPSQTMMSLCFLPAGSTTPQPFHSVGVFVTDVEVSPSSVLKASNQEVVLKFATPSGTVGPVDRWDRIQFRHSSVSCSASSYPVALASSTMLDLTPSFIDSSVTDCPVALIQGAPTAAPTTAPTTTTNAPTTAGATAAPTTGATGSPTPQRCDYRCTTGTCVIGEFDFAEATVDASPYRLCVYSSDGSYVADYDIVELYVVDIAVRPASVQNANLQNITFSNVGFSNTPDDATLGQGDQFWFTADASSACTLVPALATASITNAHTFVSSQAVYPFDFSSVANDEFHLCVRSSTGAGRMYTGVTVYATDTVAVESATDFAILQKASNSSGGFAIKVTSSFLTAQDLFFFQLESQAACNSSHTNTSTVSSTVATNVAQFTSSGSNYFFDFLNIPSSAGALRMCVIRPLSHSVTEVIELSSVSLTLAELTLATKSVFNLATQPLSIDVVAGIEVGDQIFVVAGSSSCLSAAPTTSTSAATAGATVAQINNGTLDLSLNFEQFAGSQTGSSTTLCVSSSNRTPMSFGPGPIVFSKSQEILSFRLARRASGQAGEVGNGGVSITNYQVFLVDSEEPCDNTVLALTTGDSTKIKGVVAPSPSPTTDTCTFDFSSARLANRLLRLCTGNSAQTDTAQTDYAKDFSAVGVIVSDITVMGSDSVNVDSVGCVSPQTAQSIAFTQTSLLSFDVDSKFFFKRSTASDNTCGTAPATSSVTSSAATSMIYVDTVAFTQSWSLEFDFTNSQSSFDVYRLCVELPSGTVLDYRPLGVRVSTASVSVVTPGGGSASNSVKPLAGQQLSIAFPSTMLSSASTVWFIDSTDQYLTCSCTDNVPNTCASPTSVPGISDKVNIASTSVQTFNFSAFGTNPQTAKMCVKQSASVHTLDCLTVEFDVSVAPASVPSNTGQLVQLSFSGGTLAQGDVVMFVHPQFDCSGSVNFTTAHTTSPTGYSSSATVGASGAFLSFDMDGMQTAQNVAAVLCVYDTASGMVFSVPSATIEVTARVVGIAGDPHVRSASGAWLDFYGDAGVYELLAGDIKANARFGFAVRDNFMIWHPKVMRPGTLIEEVGIQLSGHTSLRMGVQGGGIVSVREETKPTDFWARAEDHFMQVGDYTITWSTCLKDCDVVMPWGSHQRSQSLTVEGRGEFLQLFVAKSGGYRFIDVEAIPSPASTGLLADAASAPETLATLLLRGGEDAYKAHVPVLHS